MSKKTYVVGYARVSSPKQAQIGQGLENQESYIRRHCEQNNWELFPEGQVFMEPFTGTNTNRPVYNKILDILKTSNKKEKVINHFVFWDFDRLTRAGTIDYDKIWDDVKNYGVTLRDTAGIIQDEKNAFEHLGLKKQYDFAVARPSEDTERTKIEDARKDRVKILKRLIEPEIKLTQEGYHIGRPDFGFQNKRIYVEGKKKYIQERYEPEAKFIELIYKLRSENLKTDQEICDEVNALGYKSRIMNRWSSDKMKILKTIGGNTLTVKHLQKIIQRTTYCGVLCEEWTNCLPIKAKYDGLVSLKIWNDANKGKVFIQQKNDGSLGMFRDYNIHSKKRHKYNPRFPFKGVLKCEYCNKPMKASASTGKSGEKFGAYHCERGHQRLSINEKSVNLAFTNFFESIAFTPDFLIILERTLLWKFRNKEGEAAELVAQANINVAELKMQKSQLIKSFAVATIKEVQMGIEEEILTLQEKIKDAENKRDELGVSEQDIIDFIAWCKKIMEHPQKILEDISNSTEQKEIFSLFFSESPTYNELVSGTPKISFVFKLSSEFKADKSALVSVLVIEPLCILVG